MHNYFILILMALIFLLVIFTGIKSKIQNNDFSGIPPLVKPLFIFGKTASFASWLFPVYRALSIHEPSRFAVSPPVSWSAVGFMGAGALLMYTAFLTLGKANKLGLPEEKTTLRTGGIYRLSRNPMYLSFLLINISSCLYYPNPLNLIAGAVSAVIHHFILLKEEKFLEGAFGEEWAVYREKTGRYFF